LQGTTSHGGHSTKTAVVTSRIAFEDIAQLHTLAAERNTTISALISRCVHSTLPLMVAGEADDASK